MFIGETIGPFRIERELGSGAMGTVYRADYQKDDEQHRAVALKIVALGLLGNEAALARFEREASILKQLRHPNIVRLIATGRYKKTPFIAMEFVQGEALDRILSRRGRLGWEEVFGYVKQLCQALQFAHDKGIIHRDLKPSNLMITPEGTLKLTDFGIAKDQDVTALTGANSTIGTAAYMSPEQCKGERNLTGRSDLYSLGVVMYELVTGRKPFTAETTVEMFLKHVHDKPVRPTRYVGDLPIWVETLILHLLEKNPEDRPRDAAIVGRMLEEIEQKVASQKSLGEAAATTRRGDHTLPSTELDQSDREALRSLRENKRKRKRKRTSVEQTESRWRFLPPVLGLLVLIGVLTYLLWPSGADQLFAEIQAAKSAEERIDKAERYLSEFGREGNQRTAEVSQLLREARGRKLDTILSTRYRTNRFRTAQEREDAENYENAWLALEAEEQGEPARAAMLWQKVLDRGVVTDQYAEGWLWLAETHLREIRSLEELLTEIRKELANRDVFGGDWKFDAADPRSLATVAVRLGGAGGPSPAVADPKFPPLPYHRDDEKALKTWRALAELTRGKPDLRAWNILAQREITALGSQKKNSESANRAKQLQDQFERIHSAWKQVANDPNLEVARRDCRNRCRDIIELYDDETDQVMRQVVSQARQLLTEMTAAKPGGT